MDGLLDLDTITNIVGRKIVEFYKKSGLTINGQEIFVLILLVERAKEKYKLFSQHGGEPSPKLKEWDGFWMFLLDVIFHDHRIIIYKWEYSKEWVDLGGLGMFGGQRGLGLNKIKPHNFLHCYPAKNSIISTVTLQKYAQRLVWFLMSHTAKNKVVIF